jgi:DNA-binding transcriptional ArsR family regulator
MKLSLKIIAVLAMKPDGLSYKEISSITKYHINTISRYISWLYNKEIVDIIQNKSSSIRGRKWVNIARLKKELLECRSITEFYNKVVKKAGGLNDIFVD